MVYLNGKADFTGGSTLFFPSKTSDEVIDSFLPDAGDLIIFDHAIWHSGSMVVSGPKHHIGTVLSLTKLDDNTFFSSGADGKIFLWNTQTGTQIGEWLLHSDWCRKIGVISQNPTILFTLSEDFTFKLWKFENLDMILLSQYTDCYPLTVFAFESESKTLWVGNK
jgi:WD40 repeat protein